MKPEIKAPASLGSGKIPLPGFLTWQRKRERTWTSPSLYKVTSPIRSFTPMTSAKSNDLPRAQPWNAVTLEIKATTHEFGDDTSIQSIAVPYSIGLCLTPSALASPLFPWAQWTSLKWLRTETSWHSLGIFLLAGCWVPRLLEMLSGGDHWCKTQSFTHIVPACIVSGHVFPPHTPVYLISNLALFKTLLNHPSHLVV